MQFRPKMMAAENPAFASTGKAASSEPAADIEAALKDGTLDGGAAIAQMEQRMERMRLEMQQQSGGRRRAEGS